MRLGEAEAAEPLAARERLQVFLLLRVGAEREDRPAHDRVLHADDRGRRAVAGGDLLERERQRHVVHRRAAPLLGHDHAERAELAKLAQLLAREVRLAVPARGVRRELALRERAHRLADELVLLAKQHRRAAPRGGSVRLRRKMPPTTSAPPTSIDASSGSPSTCTPRATGEYGHEIDEHRRAGGADATHAVVEQRERRLPCRRSR